MQLPEKIKVAGFDIDVESWDPEKADEDRAYGDFSSSKLRIRVDCSVNKYKVLDTIIHEINHAIYWAYGIEDEDKQERLCGAFATAWLQVYRDNSKLIDFINDILK